MDCHIHYTGLMDESTSSVYERLWTDASAALDAGAPELDARLPGKRGDARRGVTLVFRPSLEVQSKVSERLADFDAACPQQYLYHPNELHVTVLTLITMTTDWERQMGAVDAFRSVVSQSLAGLPKFRIRFQGVTASRGVVMIQGFPLGDGLLNIRESVRRGFAANGLRGMLDGRYKVTAAHISALRFCTPRPVGDWQSLRALLARSRDAFFGEMEVNAVSVIFGDWYASAEHVRTLATHPLGTQIGLDR